MSVSVVSVCNSALIKVGAARISSITQDTHSAQTLNAIFNTVRDEVLRAHPWNFAIKRVQLAPNDTVPEFGYDYQYDKPNDLLRFYSVDPDDIVHVIEGDQILSDETTLNSLYIARIEDPTLWDSCFAEALSWRLAKEISYSLTQSSTLSEQLSKGYKDALSQARTIDGMEGSIQSINSSGWVDIRK
jgi:hypothetical protein